MTSQEILRFMEVPGGNVSFFCIVMEVMFIQNIPQNCLILPNKGIMAILVIFEFRKKTNCYLN